MISDTKNTKLNSEDESDEIELPAYPPTNWWGRTYRKVEQRLSNLCFNNNFWYKVLTTIYLPLAAKSKMMLGKQVGDVYETTLPFKRFNKNWYDAMAGAALLANTEVAGGMAIFKQVGEKYTVVCKEMHYKFRLPCQTDAIYRVKVLDDVKKLMRIKPEFNVLMQIDVMAEIKNKMRKIGSSTITFHVAAKSLMAQRIYKAKQKSLGR
ncbi:hypothetical protein N9F44_00470 [Akkermansiaceae bacterium]|nr:hypothetical protein [Akkermansiaceae bacterium]MDB4262432.1 hypothetical protein [bacterium]MDA7519385.1 hypothetical protein [Akkermansiaceae bacterium]MDA8975462.1 hypothetical protein [Akkermansiaceae bacterium]MDB0055711.1 hypothetical protein [Akkermansiaceae bacterium]